jgi:hypothetical protein
LDLFFLLFTGGVRGIVGVDDEIASTAAKGGEVEAASAEAGVDGRALDDSCVG